MGSVSLIIVNYNAGDRLIRCLDAVMAQTVRPDEIFVVDNASMDGSLARAMQAHPSVKPLAMAENLGFAAGNNRAAAAASGAWIALLNPDAYPEPGWLEELLAATKRWPDARAFGSTQLKDEDPDIIDGAGDCLHALGVPYRGHFEWPASALPAEAAVLSPCAAAALYHRETYLDIGGLDERFFCYCEDIDLGIRLLHAGFPSVQVPSAVVRHEGSGVTGRHSSFTVYHGHRNRVWLTAKALPPLLFYGLLPFQLLVDLAFILKFAPTPVGRPYRRAILDGLRQVPALRREIRSRSMLTSRALAPRLVWSPLALIKRRGKFWPNDADGGKAKG